MCQSGLYCPNWWPTGSSGGSFVAFWWLFDGLLAFWWLFGGSPVALCRLDVVNWWSSHPLPPSEAVSAIQSPRTPEERIRPPPCPPPPFRRHWHLVFASLNDDRRVIDDHLFLPTSRFIRKAKKYSVKARSTFQYNDAKMQPSKCQVPELSFL